MTIDIVRDALRQESKAIVIFSEDQDLSEAINELKIIAKSQNRYIHIFSATTTLSFSVWEAYLWFRTYKNIRSRL